MKNNFKKILLSLGFCLSATHFSYAQATTQEEMIQKRASEKVAQLNDYITFMSDRKKSIENRRHYKTKALNFFVGKGYSYEENGIEKVGVITEVTNSRQKKYSRLTRNFFDNLITLSPYNKVKITSIEIANIKASNVMQIDEDLYVCTCQYDQTFVGYRDGRPVYKDITTKRIKCYVTLSTSEDGMIDYYGLLGDMTVNILEKD